jgi:hypothetical protein
LIAHVDPPRIEFAKPIPAARLEIKSQIGKAAGDFVVSSRVWVQADFIAFDGVPARPRRLDFAFGL